jgi:haloalkane dehalogenase
MHCLRTPDERFGNLPDFDFSPNYLELDDTEGGHLRMHFLDEGPSDAAPVLVLHGEPTWCYLYRHMIPIFVAAGHRVLAPDLVGFGRSDKPPERSDHTYQRHVDWMAEWLRTLDLTGITLVCQDWGD